MLSRRLAAEALGTLLLVATVIGSGIMAERLADGNAAVALIGNTLATSAMLYVLIVLFGPISGAHFNPAVTTVFVLRGELGLPTAVLFVVVQCIGAVGGVLLAHAMFGLAPLAAGLAERGTPGEWLGEGVATFALVLTILGFLRYRPDAVPAAVASVIAAGYWFTSSTSFANPAVTLARAFTPTFSGIRPEDAPAFVAAQFAGAVVALAVSALLFGRGSGHGDKKPGGA